ncbi:hypothetical protein DFH28DRAFT_902919 [Melampsora americana]|nr:hypothetical protein DFH28DRAFT_902919 [Melampsora americana]
MGLVIRFIRLDLEVRGSQGGHGLGLFTRQDIPKGCFICIYAGEIIRQDEARRRWEQRAKNSAGNYTLVIREASGTSIWKTIVDPTHRGNSQWIIRSFFLDHACPPLASLIILPVRPAGQMIPQPALFAGRDIVRGEELSFDYADASGILWTETGSNSRQEELGHKTLTKCLCGSSR